jgi:hypothetical protein
MDDGISLESLPRTAAATRSGIDRGPHLGAQLYVSPCKDLGLEVEGEESR